MRFDINYEAGTSHMVGLYDRPYTEETPDPTRSFGLVPRDVLSNMKAMNMSWVMAPTLGSLKTTRCGQ